VSLFNGYPVVGPIRGYRWWRATPDGWLESMWWGRFRWHAGANEAACLSARRYLFHLGWRRRHPSGLPGQGCACGFYALHRLPSVNDTAGALWDMDPGATSGSKGVVFGVVAAWGHVLIGTEGWRAQFASPLALFVPEGSIMAGRADLLAMNYGVPVVSRVEVLRSEFGPEESLAGLLGTDRAA
jgi:hypothetical protein